MTLKNRVNDISRQKRRFTKMMAYHLTILVLLVPGIIMLSLFYWVLAASIALLLPINFFMLRYSSAAYNKKQPGLIKEQESMICAAGDEGTMIALLDAEGIIQYVNENYCRISKYSLQELTGQDPGSRGGPHHAVFFDYYKGAHAGRQIFKGELRSKAKDGAVYWVDAAIVPLTGSDGSVYQYIFAGSDITKRKVTEEQHLHLSEEVKKKSEELAGTFERITDGFFLLDTNLCYSYANKRYGEMVKKDPLLLNGKHVLDEHTASINSLLFNDLESALHENRYICNLNYYQHLDLWHENHIYPTEEGLSVFTRDVSEQKLAAQKILDLNKELSRNEKRFRGLIENNYEMVAIIDKHFRPVYRSPSCTRITGWTDEEMTRPGSIEQIHPDDIQRLMSVVSTVLEHPGIPFPIDFRTKHKQGHYVYLDGMITNMLQNEAIRGIIANFRDVSETRKAEENTRKNESIYKTIASSIPGSAIVLLDKDYRYFLIEGDLLEKIGYSKDQLMGKTIHEVITPERYDELLPEFERVFSGETFTVYNNRGRYHTVTRFVPLKEEDNKVYAAMLVIIDVTELKKAEQRITELNIGLEQKVMKRTTQLEAANKELEAFSYSVSHDLRAPLRIIDGFGQILLEDYASLLDKEGLRTVTVIMNNARKMGQLIDDLLRFSKLGRSEMKMSIVNMDELVSTVIQELESGGTAIPVNLVVHPLKAAVADANLLKQVWINLVSNAIKYSGNRQDPQVEIGMLEKEGKDIYFIKDNGAGFDMQYADKLFGVFQRLHRQDEFSGTGVGLALVKRIIARHEGTIWARAFENKGATFYFTLS